MDNPKPEYRKSNNGNTAKQFFKNENVSNNITGTDIEIFKRLRTIYKTVSGYCINILPFKEYALKTAHLFIEKYFWFSMSPIVHKVL